jgi:Ca2+-binding EF-hand superfamily protein
MPFFVAIAAALAVAAQAGDDEPPIKVLGYPWAPFISPMGEPFRARSAGDDPFARWFHQADRNRDGLLTVDEMRADAERFFQALDGNRDGEIDPEELVVYETEVAPEVQVNSRWKRSAQAVAEAKSRKRPGGDDRERWRADEYIDGYQPHGLQGAARYGLLNIPQPVAGADADFDRATNLHEFQHAAIQRFELLDSKRVGRLTLQELEPLLPNRPTKRGRVRRSKDEPTDKRIGQPFPEGN